MKTVSMLELRQNSEAVVSDLQRGLPLTLTYRGKPLAKLVPIAADLREITADDPLYKLAVHAGAGSSENASLSNAEIDRALYGQP